MSGVFVQQVHRILLYDILTEFSLGLERYGYENKFFIVGCRSLHCSHIEHNMFNIKKSLELTSSVREKEHITTGVRLPLPF